MTPRDRALLFSPPIAGLLYFAAAYIVGRWQDAAVDRGVRLLDGLRL
jgi:hypothetical protein